MKDDELIKKCKNCEFDKDSDVMSKCKAVLGDIENCKDELSLTDEQTQTYLKMAENLKPEDVSKVLELALRIRESGAIKDPNVKINASRLIRAIEMG